MTLVKVLKVVKKGESGALKLPQSTNYSTNSNTNIIAKIEMK
jgi:hypothetical protein